MQRPVQCQYRHHQNRHIISIRGRIKIELIACDGVGRQYSLEDKHFFVSSLTYSPFVCIVQLANTQGNKTRKVLLPSINKKEYFRM